MCVCVCVCVYVCTCVCMYVIYVPVFIEPFSQSIVRTHDLYPTLPLSQPDQHTRELNPYWKDGGSGVPEDKPAAISVPQGPSAAGDAGLSWLRKAYDRCKQQALDEGRSLEDVAADRYGVSHRAL